MHALSTILTLTGFAVLIIHALPSTPISSADLSLLQNCLKPSSLSKYLELGSIPQRSRTMFCADLIRRYFESSAQERSFSSKSPSSQLKTPRETQFFEHESDLDDDDNQNDARNSDDDATQESEDLLSKQAEIDTRNPLPLQKVYPVLGPPLVHATEPMDLQSLFAHVHLPRNVPSTDFLLHSQSGQKSEAVRQLNSERGMYNHDAKNGGNDEFEDSGLSHVGGNGASRVSKRVLGSSWLAALKRYSNKSKRRRTLSINNALVSLTDMLVQRGIDRLNRNRQSMRRHMMLQG